VHVRSNAFALKFAATARLKKELQLKGRGKQVFYNIEGLGANGGTEGLNF